MNILVIGGGAREDAIIMGLVKSPLVKNIWCAPGNGGTRNQIVGSSGARVENLRIEADNLSGLAQFATERMPDLTVVGPEVPLALGVVNRFQNLGFKIFGPNQRAALFESSKVFSHNFNGRWNIPKPSGKTFDSPWKANEYVNTIFDSGRTCVVKVDGPAKGKGVDLCSTTEEARASIERFIVKEELGSSGHRIVIQEKLFGEEFSAQVLCDGSVCKLLPIAKDYKRLLDGNLGPNTGGMGAYSTPEMDQCEPELETILMRWRNGCMADRIEYRGVLYPGLMVVKRSYVYVLEFNCRFGDPEIETLIPRLESDLAELLLATVEGRLKNIEPRWSSDACVCVILASREYPLPSVKGHLITGISEAEKIPGVKVFHGSTIASSYTLGGTGFRTGEGRILAVTGKAKTLELARKTTYAGVECIKFEGMQYRGDIAKEV